MKFHWGWAIVFAFVVFAAGLFYVIWRSSLSPTEMVTDDYYEKTVMHQNIIDMEENYRSLTGKLKTQKSDSNFQILFPEDFSGKNVSGKIEFYRPSKRVLDFNVEFNLSDSNVLEVPYDQLLEGMWTLKATWECEGVKYYHEHRIRI